MEKNKLNILNKIFSRSTFRNCFDTGKQNSELISQIYNVLREGYRNEYYYKNTLLNKLLLGIHSVNTTTALTEIPIAKSKADFVLINGKAVVYEIKTELDNFDRLENQINDYYKAFDHVAVVTCKENLQVLKKKIEMIGKPVGIYILQKRGTITTIQKPQAYSVELDAEILFNKYKHLPDVSEFKYYSECKKMFLEIPLEEAYLSVLKLLKKRSQIIKDEFSKIPYELKFLAYFMNLKSDDYKKITKFLNESYGGV